ncbi:Zinc finger RING-type [Penicillium coprophilum]|uniref:Zinc finger RING-type n=1 Tax=Penicillium coprophilum TaxID=36646 RepID=UPI00238FB038|nr:Zinc finger RING-type [Penicillium coprophilum]KAJ5158399.1 Zinc finger RING-type [Penicillium coprophilum]
MHGRSRLIRSLSSPGLPRTRPNSPKTLPKPKSSQRTKQQPLQRNHHGRPPHESKTPARALEKGKELAAEIERRMALDPPIKFPTHFCHNCVQDGEMVEVLLTKCGHRVCRTCLDFLTDADGQYECSICFVPAEFVARSPLALIQDFPEIPTPFKGRGSWDGGVPTGDRDWDMSEVLFSDR